jgi:hypothetical protein
VLPIVAVTVGAFVLSGCGDDSDYENRLRPPSPINVTAVIGDGSISLSPSKLGAGPIVIIVSNQSDASQVATLDVDELNSPGSKKKAPTKQASCPAIVCTGPINPQDTAQVKVVVEPDTTYTLKTDEDAIEPAELRVGEERPSAQNDTLTP